jgi:hypothetical protein
MEQLRHFQYTEGAENPLKRVSNIDILKSIIDPTTGKQYDGIILEGEFASIDTLNNNNRIYTEANYIGFVEQLKKQAHSPKGLYGQYEHPKTYSSDGNLLSHKILDIWYDQSVKKVFGIIMLLNTTAGKEAQEVIKSGGLLSVSARGGGSEVQNPDGTITAVLKLMITFDIVHHPGFTSAIVGFTKLNESRGCISYDSNIGKLIQFYESYIINNENVQLFESSEETKAAKTKNKEEEKILETGEAPNQKEIENRLSSVVDKQLTESQKDFHNQMNRATGKFKKLNNAVYDNSAGFLSENEDFNPFG